MTVAEDPLDRPVASGPPVRDRGMGERDRFLDAIRALALVRVVAWHATGAAALTYVFSAIPTMFFVSGALFATSAARRAPLEVLRDRLRRLFPSLWVFTALVGTAMALGAWHSSTPFPVRNVAGWLLPIWNPEGTVWEQQRLSSHLWYVRVLLWIIVLAPLLVTVARRWPRSAITLAVGAVLVLDVVDRHVLVAPSWSVSPLWQVGDVVMYGAFFVLGVLFARGSFAGLTTRTSLAVAGAAACGAALWWATQPVPEGVVNNSHPMHLLVGTTWLFVLLPARAAIGRVASGGGVGRLVDFIARRSLTIYLWHSVAIFVAIHLVIRSPDWPMPAPAVLYAAFIAAATLAAVIAFGGVEDLAARRRAAAWPVATAMRQPAFAAATAACAVLVMGAGLAVASDRSGASLTAMGWPPAPSQAPPRPFAHGDHLIDPSFDEDRFVARIQAWMAATGAPDVVVAVEHGGEIWSYVDGVGHDGAARTIDDRVELMSITKLFTANLVHRAADAGHLELDAGFPPLDADPAFPYTGQFTIRDALAHRTGLTTYWSSTAYLEDPSTIASPRDAIDATVAEPLEAPPGTVPVYSSTNYLLLGLLLEQATGRTYDDLLRNELLEPLGLGGMTHEPPGPGRPNFSTGGLQATPEEALRAGRALLADHFGLGRSMVELAEVSPDDGFGAGVHGFCPCREAMDSRRFTAYGYAGGRTVVAWVPESDLVVVIDSGAELPAHTELLHQLFSRHPADPASGEASAEGDSAPRPLERRPARPSAR